MKESDLVSKKNLCPSCKVNKLLAGEKKKFNARSTVHGKLICAECALDEIIAKFN